MLQNPYDPSFGTEDVSFTWLYSQTCLLSAGLLQSCCHNVVHLNLALSSGASHMPDASLAHAV